jgi:hypothetical protein
MATEIPFGLSFGNYGDPRKYMGQGESPAKKIQQKIAKIQKSPVANLLGIGLAGMGGESAPSPVPAMGQGISAPVVPPVGINPNASGVGIAPGSFQIPNLTLPQIGLPTMQDQGADLDGDGVIDNFWGLNK